MKKKILPPMTVQKMILVLELIPGMRTFVLLTFKTLHNFFFIVITIKIDPLKDAFFLICAFYSYVGVI